MFHKAEKCGLCYVGYFQVCMVAGADPNLRDWSGRKPRQYQLSQDTSVSADTFRSEYLSDRLSSVRLPTNPSPAANNNHPKIQKSFSNRNFLRMSLMSSDRKKYRLTKYSTLYPKYATLRKWLSHVTGIVKLSGLLVWIMETTENPYSMENITFWRNANVTPIAQHCVFFKLDTHSVCLSFTK